MPFVSNAFTVLLRHWDPVTPERGAVVIAFVCSRFSLATKQCTLAFSASSSTEAGATTTSTGAPERYCLPCLMPRYVRLSACARACVSCTRVSGVRFQQGPLFAFQVPVPVDCLVMSNYLRMLAHTRACACSCARACA